jgi:uncharacterized protein (TIGR02246 family)
MSARRRAPGRVGLRQVLYFSVSLTLGGCGLQSDDSPPLVRKESWEAAFNRGDAAAVAGLYSQDAELIVSGERPIHGRRAISRALAKMMQPGIRVHIETARAAAAGSLAYFYGPYTVLQQQRVVERGMYLEVWHQYGGRWLIDLDVNSRGPPSPSSSQH